MKEQLTQSRLKEILSYCPESGEFKWVVNRGKARIGKKAGYVAASGYVRINTEGRVQYAHRLAWLYVNGEWPEFDVDHVNGVKSDNRLANLRAATRAENMQNISAARADNKSSGLLGVSRPKGFKKWRAQIQVSGKNFYLGCYETPEQASAAYLEAKESVHRFFVPQRNFT